MSGSSQDAARQLIERFGFKKRLDEIIDFKDDSLIPIFTANLAIFAVCSTVLFGENGRVATASILLILISAVISLAGSLLNIWYLVRFKKRSDYLKEVQEKVFNKAELKLVKTFDLLKKITTTNILQKAEAILEKNENIEGLSNKLKSDTSFDFLAEEAVFIPMTILELAFSETRLNIGKCLDEPLDEKWPGIKLFVDRLSDRSKNSALVLSSAFLLGALLVKFIVEQ